MVVEREGSDMSKQGSKLLDKHILQSRGMILKFNLYRILSTLLL